MEIISSLGENDVRIFAKVQLAPLTAGKYEVIVIPRAMEMMIPSLAFVGHKGQQLHFLVQEELTILTLELDLLTVQDKN